MNTKSNNSMETVLKEIIRLRGLAVLADGRVLVSLYCDLSNEKKDQRLLRYFVECGGHTALLGTQNLSPAMQKARFNQTVNKMCAETLVSEEVARQVCNAFWIAVYGRPMEEAAVPSQQNQELQQQKTQPVPRPIQQTTPAQHTKPIQKTEPVCAKRCFYMTADEYRAGGDIPVYFSDGTKQIVAFPPNAQSHHKGLPDKIYVGNPIRRYNLKNLQDYSDGCLQEYLDKGWLKSAFSNIWIDISWILFWYLGFPMVTFFANWLMETVLPFDLFRGIKFTGFGLEQLLEHYKICYTVSPDSFGDWVVLIISFFPIAVAILSVVWALKDANNDRKNIRKEIERRKMVSLRK